MAGESPAVLRDLLERLGLPDDARVEPAAGGASGAAWMVRHGRRRWVLRVYGPDRLTDARLAAMEAAAAADLPVPRLIARADADGTVGLLLTYLPGRPLLEAMRAEPSRAARWARAMGALQRRLHEVVAPPSMPAVAEDPAHPFGAGRSPDLPAGDALLHLDWHPGNLLVDSAGGEISGILDWDNARRGHPLLDVARTESMLTIEPSLKNLPAPLRSTFDDIRAAWADGYGPEATAIPDPCRRWAGRVMLADLAPRYAAGSDLLESARRWADGRFGS